MSERREAPRLRASKLVARVRPGHRVRVVNVSTGGALFEGVQPLRPGAAVEVQFEHAERRIRIAGLVLRCGITALDPHRGPTYRTAVAFEATFEWARRDDPRRV